MRTIVAGNWKMHKDAVEARNLTDAVKGWVDAHGPDVLVVLAPPFPFLASTVEQVADLLDERRMPRVLVAAQNCHEEEKGAFTGEVSVPMLKSIGVSACIVGHSERRQYFGETDAAVGRKIAMLIKHGLLPVYCCGEQREEREEGRFRDVVASQLHGALGTMDPSDIERIVVAYEPVWAIGTGLTASPEQAQEMHAFIRQELRNLAGDAALGIPILYGGSCKPDNAADLFASPDINGGLIGGAALVAEQFTGLLRIANEGGKA
jgi:triosephosphate isomerase